MNTLRALTYAHLSRPDPVAWLAAADLYEERGQKGDAEIARLWRRRGEWYPPLMKLVEELRGCALHAERDLRLGPFTVGLRRARRSVVVHAWGRDPVNPAYAFWWGYHAKEGRRYLTRCAVTMIDILNRRMAVEGESS